MKLFSIEGRFLDYGAGRGDVAEHLAGRFPQHDGYAFDLSFSDRQVSLANEKKKKPGLTFTNRIDVIEGKVDYTVLFDVIEHVPDASRVLREIYDLTADSGWLTVTMPYNSREWGIDDEFYGHLRRMSRDGVVSMLESNGWNVVRVLDPTFPSFWLLRRLFLLLSRFTNVLLHEEIKVAEGSADLERTFESSRRNIWSENNRTLNYVMNLLSRSTWQWKILRKLDLYFETVFLGFELFVVCQKRERSLKCEVCRNSNYTFSGFFGGYALQRCGRCGSERILPECTEDLYNRDYYSRRGERFPKIIERFVNYFRTSNARFIRRLPVPERSVLDIGCGRGITLKDLRQRGWRTMGTQLSENAAAAARKGGVEVIIADIDAIPTDRPFAVVTLFHVIEHFDNLADSLERIDKLLLPGGYLILEYPSARSVLKSLLKWRWFAYDPPHHRLQINPDILSDTLGLNNYRPIYESNFSLEYSFFVFAQSITNLLFPFQRDSFYRALLNSENLSLFNIFMALASVPVFIACLPLFLLYQPLVSFFYRGCIVRQVFKKTISEGHLSWDRGE